MSPAKVLLYLVVGLLALVVMSAVVSVIFATIALVWLALRLLVVLAVFGIVGYVGYRVYRALTGLPVIGRSSSSGVSDSSSTDISDEQRIDDLKRRYASGELTEQEFERRLERELDDRHYDSIDRELQREDL